MKSFVSQVSRDAQHDSIYDYVYGNHTQPLDDTVYSSRYPYWNHAT